MIQTQTFTQVPLDGAARWATPEEIDKGLGQAYLSDLDPGRVITREDQITVDVIDSPEQRAAREAREAVEAQRRDQLDREEREAAAKRAHALDVMKLTLDHNVAVRSACSVTYDNVALLMGGAAALGALIAGLAAAAIP